MLTLLRSGTEQNILKQGHGDSKLERKETLTPVSESWVGKEWDWESGGQLAAQVASFPVVSCFSPPPYCFEHNYPQWHPTPVLLPGKSRGWKSLVGCSPWGHGESDRTDRLYFHFSPALGQCSEKLSKVP